MANRTILMPFVTDPQVVAEHRPAESIYQVYPATFADSNGDGCGDLRGIINHLDYIKNLGQDAIWISPFYLCPPDPDGDGGYAVTDHRKINPKYGTIKDFQELLDKAHAKGLKIYIDFVMCHTANDHEWFEKSRRREAPYDDYYVWSDGGRDATGKRIPPNNWKSVFGGSAWSLDAKRDQWYMHHFLKTQPALNLNAPKVQDAMLADMKFWLDMGVNGVRLDALPFATHDVQLRNNPWLDGKWPRHSEDWSEQRFEHSICQPETVDLVKRIRVMMDSYPDKRMTLGEVLSGREGGSNSVPLAAAYVDGKSGLDMCYTEALMAIGEYPKQDQLKRMIALVEGSFPADGGNCNAASNHDMARSATRMTAHTPPGDKDKIVRQLMQLFVCLPGSFCMYQGEELGLPQARIPEDIPVAALKDPVATTRGIGACRDGARTPMPWKTGEKNAGFSTSAAPYLPVPQSHYDLAVDRQESTPDSMLHFSRRLMAWRKAQSALISGQTIVIDNKSDVLAFLRISKGQTMLCLFNMSGTSQNFTPSQHMDAALLKKLNLQPGQTISVGAYGADFHGAEPAPPASCSPPAAQGRKPSAPPEP